MRGSPKLPVIPDILSLLAIVALVTVVYLCSLPQTFHSLSHRKADAAQLLVTARNHIIKEGALFGQLAESGEDEARLKLRSDLHDNERRFHDISLQVTNTLPEAKSAIDQLVSEFDSLADTGWQADKEAGEGRQHIMQSRFFPALNELRDRSEAIEHNLHRQDTKLRLPGEQRPASARVALHVT